jgi:hypothetical protein
MSAGVSGAEKLDIRRTLEGIGRPASIIARRNGGNPNALRQR